MTDSNGPDFDRYNGSINIPLEPMAKIAEATNGPKFACFCILALNWLYVDEAPLWFPTVSLVLIAGLGFASWRMRKRE